MCAHNMYAWVHITFRNIIRQEKMGLQTPKPTKEPPPQKLHQQKLTK